MKRLIPYIFLQISLSSLMGCAAMRTAEKQETRTAYQVTLVVASPYNEDMSHVLAGVPGATLTGPLRINALNPTESPYQQYEFRLPDQGALQVLKNSLQNAGVPIAGFQVKEVSL